MNKSILCAGPALFAVFPMLAFAQVDPGAAGCAFGTDFTALPAIVQPAGIALNAGGVSNIYYPFEDWETGWAAYPGSQSHHGDDLYAQDFRLNNNHALSDGRNVFAGISGYVACTANVQPALFGNQMVIWDPSSGFALRYAHLLSVNPALRPGDFVLAGNTLVGQVGNSGLNTSGQHHLHLALYKGVNKLAGTPLVQVQYTGCNSSGCTGTPFAAPYTLVTNPTPKPFTMLFPGHGGIHTGGKPWTRATPLCLSGATDTTLGLIGSNVFEFVDLDASCNRWYTRNGDLDSNDDVSLEVRVAVDSSSEPGALVAGLADGTRKYQVGIMPGAVGLVGAAGFLSSVALDATTMHTYRLVKNNTTDEVELYVDPDLDPAAPPLKAPYSSFPNFTATTYRQFFGAPLNPGMAEGYFDYVLYVNTVR